MEAEGGKWELVKNHGDTDSPDKWPEGIQGLDAFDELI